MKGKSYTIEEKIGCCAREGEPEMIAALNVQGYSVRLVSRVAFSRSLITGPTAQEFEPDGKASHEIAQLQT